MVEVAFALSHHEAVKIAETPATALAALARQGRGGTSEHADSAGTRRVSQSKASGDQQFPQTCSSGGGYEVWIALQQLDANALGHHEETRRLIEGSLGGTGVHGPAAGSKTHSLAYSLQERQTAVSDGGRIFENESL